MIAFEIRVIKRACNSPLELSKRRIDMEYEEKKEVKRGRFIIFSGVVIWR